jgi:crotonobetaine/carnitine-CoA ligase
MRTFTELQPRHDDQVRWNLPDVVREWARRRPQHPYLEVPEEGASYTYGEILDLSERIASGLMDDGAKFGDRILIMVPNSAAWMLAWFGSSFAGMAAAGINIAYVGDFLRHQVDISAPTGAVIDVDYAERFVAVAEGCRSIRTFYLTGDGAKFEAATEDLISSGFVVKTFSELCTNQKRDLPTVGPADVAAVFFTSGTTGLSKGTLMPHGQMYLFSHECTSMTRLTEEDIYLSSGPLFHANSSLLAGYAALIAGATFVLHRKFSASKWTSWIRESRATVTNFVSVMMAFVWKQPPRPDDRDNNLRCIFACPTAHGLIEGFKERFGVEIFVDAYGMSEICCVVLAPYGERRPYGAVGLAVSDYFEVKIVDPETDIEVPVGEVGEVVIRPKLPWIITQGYVGMPDKTVEAWRNLWFHTGDGLRRDQDGWFYWVDRLKDSIRRRGENISSQEVEQAILQHPDIADVAVIAVEAEFEAGDQEVVAVVVPATGVELDVRALHEWFCKMLPVFVVPRFVRVMAELPTTPSGKVLKSVLREDGVGEAVDLTPPPVDAAVR